MGAGGRMAPAMMGRARQPSAGARQRYCPKARRSCSAKMHKVRRRTCQLTAGARPPRFARKPPAPRRSQHNALPPPRPGSGGTPWPWPPCRAYRAPGRDGHRFGCRTASEACERVLGQWLTVPPAGPRLPLQLDQLADYGGAAEPLLVEPGEDRGNVCHRNNCDGFFDEVFRIEHNSSCARLLTDLGTDAISDGDERPYTPATTGPRPQSPRRCRGSHAIWPCRPCSSSSNRGSRLE